MVSEIYTFDVILKESGIKHVALVAGSRVIKSISSFAALPKAAQRSALELIIY